MSAARWCTSLAVVAAAWLAAPGVGGAQTFTYNPPGALVAGSGQGRVDFVTYVPGARFPLEEGPAFANSQVWGNGGSQGGGGSQCDAVNYAYPWWDNYCESRSWAMPLCPAGIGHQGQDIRAATCVDDTHWAVAAAPGRITSIGSYSVYLTTADGTIHRYLHMEPASVQVSVGEDVERGQRLGRVSNAFGDSSTTIHLHYDLFMDLEGVGEAYAPTYFTLIEGYEALTGLEGETCGLITTAGGILDDGDPCFVLHGPSATWRYVSTAGHDGDLYWSFAWENAASNWAEWRFTVAQAGTWRLEVYVAPTYAQAEDVRYTVRHAGGEQELRVDQSAGDGWLSLGVFSFEADGDYNVAVYDGPGELLELQHQFVADALRVTPVDLIGGADGAADVGDPVADAGPDVGEGPDAGTPDVPATPDLTEETEVGEGPDFGAEVEGDGSTPGEAVDVTVNSGCGCAAAPASSRGEAAVVLLALLWARRRSRRR